MHVLLAFHYSDDWADPYSQDVPSEWLGIVDDTTELGNVPRRPCTCLDLLTL